MLFSTVYGYENYGTIKAFDYPNNDLDFISDISYSACQSSCDLNGACVAFVTSYTGEQLDYVPNVDCWLKSKLEFGGPADDRAVYYKE